jgi:hypothetical protein
MAARSRYEPFADDTKSFVNTEIRFKSDQEDPAKRKKKRDLSALREVIKLLAIVFIVVVFFYYFVRPELPASKKLSGNQSVLALCKWELATWREYQTNGPTFDYSRLTDDQKRRVIMYGLNQDFSIRTNFDWSDASSRKIVIVSSRAYYNGPTLALWNPFLWKPAHAVGYSDGSTGLISMKEYDSLNQEGLASLWSLANDPNFKIFKQ